MKLHKSTLITVTVMLALAQRVQASEIVGTTTQFNKVNVALTVETNKPAVETSSAVVNSTGKAKLTNKTLLDMFAAWTGSNTNDWRTNGAQLIFDWDTYQLAVADHTGTNILFYAGDGITGEVQAFCTVDWFNNFGSPDWGAFTENSALVNPGTDIWNLSSQGFFELLFDDASGPDPSLDVWGYGPNKEHYIQNWDMNGAYTKWTDTESFAPFGAAKSEIFNGKDHSTLTGNITSTGTGPGRNNYLY